MDRIQRESKAARGLRGDKSTEAERAAEGAVEKISAGPYFVTVIDQNGTARVQGPGVWEDVGIAAGGRFRARDWAGSLNTAHADGARSVAGDARWLIWSNEHDAWWAPNRAGYISGPDVAGAGRYTLADAVRICLDAGMCNRLKQDPAVPAEVPVPSPELLAALIPTGATWLRCPECGAEWQAGVAGLRAFIDCRCDAVPIPIPAPTPVVKTGPGGDFTREYPKR